MKEIVLITKQDLQNKLAPADLITFIEGCYPFLFYLGIDIKAVYYIVWNTCQFDWCEWLTTNYTVPDLPICPTCGHFHNQQLFAWQSFKTDEDRHEEVLHPAKSSFFGND